MITTYVYNKRENKLLKTINLKNIGKYVNKNNFVVWVDLQDPKNADFEELENTFGFHPLAIEDCKKFTALPKIDEFEDYIFMVFHRVVFNPKRGDLGVGEIDFFLGKNYLVSLHRGVSTSINKMRDRVNARHAFMKNGADFVLHGIMDLFVDKYIPIIDRWSDEIEDIEDKVIARKTTKVLQKIINLKRNIAEFKRSITPQRDIISKLARRKFRFISEKSSIYYMDIFDNIMWVNTSLDSNRDLITNTFEAYLSVITHRTNEASNKMNKIVQRLTVIATIFMPLTFITGIYGMNFKNMPELSWQFGYFGSLGFMLFIAIVMLFYFRKKYWVD